MLSQLVFNWLKGEPKTIMNLYDKIKEDSRHTNCIMVSPSPN
ncbi:BLUF domain-containing protein [Marivirga lumbricoides]